jgi:hypothetical protein
MRVNWGIAYFFPFHKAAGSCSITMKGLQITLISISLTAGSWLLVLHRLMSGLGQLEEDGRPLVFLEEASNDCCLKVLVGIVSQDLSSRDERRKNWAVLLRMKHELRGGNVLGIRLPNQESSESSLKCGLNFEFVPSAGDDDKADVTTTNDPIATTIEWFQHASQKYPEAQYIAKMNDDTSINLRQLETDFEQARQDQASFVGRPLCCPFSISSGFYALSKRLVGLAVNAHAKYGVLHTDDEALNIAGLLEKAGFKQECCLRPSCGAVFRCHAIYSGDDLAYSRDTNKAVLFQENDGNKASTRLLGKVPRKVWAFWFGPPMEGARLAAFNQLKQNIGVPVHLVKSEDLHKFNLTYSPMHPLIGKVGLSAIHIADYLRAYFMAHFGGGYHDIKPHLQSWKSSFDEFDKDENLWLYGVNECGHDCIGCDQSSVIPESCPHPRNMTGLYDLFGGGPGGCCELIRSQAQKLVSNGAYIMRPGTLMTSSWLDIVESHLDAKMDDVLKHPAPYVRCCGDPTPPYPFRWAELHGEAFHPVQFFYNSHIKKGLSRWSGGNYRDKAEDVATGTGPQGEA